MKKIIIGLFLVSLVLIFKSGEKEILIPNEAIRFRVIANSDTLEDQNKKMVIKEKIEKEVYELIKGDSKTSEVRNTLKDNIDNIRKIVDKYDINYDINYGENYFPAKNYKGVIYKPGNYESLVITLGEGKGNNFWCVLFPPLCLLDNEKSDVGEVEYKFFVKQLLDKF